MSIGFLGVVLVVFFFREGRKKKREKKEVFSTTRGLEFPFLRLVSRALTVGDDVLGSRHATDGFGLCIDS